MLWPPALQAPALAGEQSGRAMLLDQAPSAVARAMPPITGRQTTSPEVAPRLVLSVGSLAAPLRRPEALPLALSMWAK